MWALMCGLVSGGMTPFQAPWLFVAGIVLTGPLVCGASQIINDFHDQCRYLPVPQSLRVDSSPIAERVSLNYHYNDSSTTYQGEYPFQMASLNKSSFWSFDLLKEQYLSNQLDFESYLILMKINRDADVTCDVDLEIYNPDTRSSKLSFKAKQNGFTILSLRDVGSLFCFDDCNTPLFFQCNDCTFIPMILSVNKITAQLSLEHTHPPTELLSGTDKFSIVKLIKKQWLS